jgi:hypothetical protein
MPPAPALLFGPRRLEAFRRSAAASVELGPAERDSFGGARVAVAHAGGAPLTFKTPAMRSPFGAAKHEDGTWCVALDISNAESQVPLYHALTALDGTIRRHLRQCGVHVSKAALCVRYGTSDWAVAHGSADIRLRWREGECEVTGRGSRPGALDRGCWAQATFVVKHVYVCREGRASVRLQAVQLRIV